jgi:hypothetical protein
MEGGNVMLCICSSVFVVCGYTDTYIPSIYIRLMWTALTQEYSVLFGYRRDLAMQLFHWLSKRGLGANLPTSDLMDASNDLTLLHLFSHICAVR